MRCSSAELRDTQEGPIRTFAYKFLANGVAKGTPECKDRLGFGVTDSHAKGFQNLKKYDNAVEELLKFVK